MKHYQYFLFDWDGCLARTIQVWLEEYKLLFSEYNIFPKDKEVVKKAFGDPNGPAKFGVKNSDKFLRILTKRGDKKLEKVQLYDFVPEMLVALKNQNKDMAVITSSAKSSIAPAIKNYHLKKYFKAILTRENIVKHKPNPEIIEKALKKLNGNKNKTIIVGDSKKDLEAANNAGIDSILFYPEEHSLFHDLKELKKCQPTYIIKSFKEIIRLF